MGILFICCVALRYNLDVHGGVDSHSHSFIDSKTKGVRQNERSEKKHAIKNRGNIDIQTDVDGHEANCKGRERKLSSAILALCLLNNTMSQCSMGIGITWPTASAL